MGNIRFSDRIKYIKNDLFTFFFFFTALEIKPIIGELSNTFCFVINSMSSRFSPGHPALGVPD